MSEPDDSQLLREFAVQSSEDAFSELVRRHINLVYSSALRQLRDPHLAQEASQAVFTILAQKAKSLPLDTVLPGWLYRTTRFASMTILRSQIRRQKYEREAAAAFAHEPQTDAQWSEIEPLLDEAMNRLGANERNAVLLHFFEQQTFRQVGVSLNTTEDAAQKRVSRALGKLRAFLTRRNVVISAATLGALLSAQAVQAAPAGFIGTVSLAALAKGGGPSIATLVKGTLKLMTWTKMKT